MFNTIRNSWSLSLSKSYQKFSDLSELSKTCPTLVGHVSTRTLLPGEAWDHVMKWMACCRKVARSATNVTQTFTKTVPIRYFGDHQWQVNIALEPTQACQVLLLLL